MTTAAQLVTRMLEGELATQLFLRKGNELQAITPEQAAKLMAVLRARYDDPNDVPTIKLYDSEGKEIGRVSYNGRVWVGDKEVPVGDRKTAKQHDVEGWSDFKAGSPALESLLNEIALSPKFGGEGADDNLDPDAKASIDADWAQEELWYNLANEAGLSTEDAKAAGEAAGLSHPPAAIDTAYAGAGKDFPKRGSWSGELVWIFLALVQKGLIDKAGKPTSKATNTRR